MKNLILLILFAAFSTVSINAQAAKMSSIYTNLKTDCRAEEKVAADEVPFICKAVGSYRARIIPAGAWAETIEIVNMRGETVASLGTHGYGYSTRGKRILEWRLANGNPFAVIFRINKFDSKDSPENGDSPYLDKYKTGEALIIRGLDGYSQIDFEVDGKAKNANLSAQKKADENFQ